MMTLDNIRNIEFSRGRGYRADEVDDFIDSCVETVEALTQENETLNQKMKVLADKITEYRNDEDNIRSALLSAQRAGETILRDANARAEQILKDAEEKAHTIREDAKTAIAAENEELARVQREVAAFKARMLSLYKEHLALINVLPEDAPPPAVSTPTEADVVVAPDTTSEEAPAAEEEQKPVSRFANLKFGTDYNIADDEDEHNDGDATDDDGVRVHNPFRKRK